MSQAVVGPAFVDPIKRPSNARVERAFFSWARFPAACEFVEVMALNRELSHPEQSVRVRALGAAHFVMLDRQSAKPIAASLAQCVIIRRAAFTESPPRLANFHEIGRGNRGSAVRHAALSARERPVLASCSSQFARAARAAAAQCDGQAIERRLSSSELRGRCPDRAEPVARAASLAHDDVPAAFEPHQAGSALRTRASNVPATCLFSQTKAGSPDRRSWNRHDRREKHPEAQRGRDARARTSRDPRGPRADRDRYRRDDRPAKSIDDGLPCHAIMLSGATSHPAPREQSAFFMGPFLIVASALVTYSSCPAR